MKKIIKILLILIGSYLYANELVINDLSVFYKSDEKIDYLYIVQGDSKLIIRQQKLWNNAEKELNLVSANEEYIELSLLYKGNNELGYIYTLKKFNNTFLLESVKIYQIRGNSICDTTLKKDNKYINIIETNICNNIDKFGLSLQELLFIAQSQRLKNILSNNELSFLIHNYPLTTKNLTQYNNIAYYLEQAGAYKEAIYLLEKIIEQYPNRTVAYINLGDAYWGDEKKEKAKKAYEKYIELMEQADRGDRIPEKVWKRIE
jgi:tetratricopeptide (TPR) repeat protein